MWCIFYGDGSTYSNEDGSIWDAPARDVQVIVQHHENVNWYSQTGGDYYIWRGNTWLGVDIFGLFDYLIDPGYKKVLFGRTISSVEFQSIFNKAKNDPKFGKKACFLKSEIQPKKEE